MLRELKEIVDGNLPDPQKVAAIREYLDRCYSQDEYKSLLLAAKGPAFDFQKSLKAMSAADLIGLLRASELDPQDYEHLDSSTDIEALRRFVESHRDYLNFDLGGHFTASSNYGNMVFNLTKTKPDGSEIEVRPSIAFRLGNLLGVFEDFETVYVRGSRISHRMQVMATINGVQVKCKTVRQPNPFQWAVEFQENGTRRVEFVEVRDITPIVTT